MRRSPALIVFSHLRWNFVYQRPQHLMARMAERRDVYFIEEPMRDSSSSGHLEVSQPAENVTVIRPHTNLEDHGFTDAQMALIKPLLTEFFASRQIQDHIAWFYTPMALPLLDGMHPSCIVYDCMDELANFLHAPRQLMERESALFQTADLVFTGGPSLYRAKKDRHPSVHCFASSVDRDHFAREVEEASDLASLPRPRVGYCGVIDERINLEILDLMALTNPDWQIVMVGPVVKISEHALPKHSNLHYLGQRSYQDLPSLIAGFDVCMMPFAQNDATRFISPTKTLEYMAARKPVVSTPITDVKEPYSEIVFLGETPEEFVDACAEALKENGSGREERLARAAEVLQYTSWDRTAQQMDLLIRDVSARRLQARLAPVRRSPAPPVTVVGAGPTGLSAAYHLGERAVLVEQRDRVGGWCRSIYKDGFTFDYAGHIMFSTDPYVHQLYDLLLGSNVHWQDREAWVYSKNVHTRYPFQGALYGLPPEVIKECIVGAMEARFGSLKQKAPVGSNGKSEANGKSEPNGAACASVNDCCADGILESSAQLGKKPQQAHSTEPKNFEEFIYKVWGAGIAKHFAIPYNRKLWSVPLTEMETSWLGGRVPLPDLEEMIEGAIKPVPKPMGPNARFGYPLHGGFQALMDGFLPHFKGNLLMNTGVAAVSPKKRQITLSDGTVQPYSTLISTMPLPALIRSIGSFAPADIREAAQSLRHVSVRCVHLGIGRPDISEKHWIYYPEDTVFHRIFLQGNASPYCNPPGGFGLTCEITYSGYKPLPCDGDVLIQRCIDDCRKVGMIREDDPVWTATQCDLPYAYVVYDHARKQSVKMIRDWLGEFGIILAGRYSEWEYYNSDHAFISGKKAAEQALTLEESMQTQRLLPGSLGALTRVASSR